MIPRKHANAILAISMTAYKAGEAEKDLPLYCHIADLAENPKFVLPVPSLSSINGRSHAGIEHERKRKKGH